MFLFSCSNIVLSLPQHVPAYNLPLHCCHISAPEQVFPYSLRRSGNWYDLSFPRCSDRKPWPSNSGMTCSAWPMRCPLLSFLVLSVLFMKVLPAAVGWAQLVLLLQILKTLNPVALHTPHSILFWWFSASYTHAVVGLFFFPTGVVLYLIPTQALNLPQAHKPKSHC